MVFGFSNHLSEETVTLFYYLSETFDFATRFHSYADSNLAPNDSILAASGSKSTPSDSILAPNDRISAPSDSI